MLRRNIISGVEYRRRRWFLIPAFNPQKVLNLISKKIKCEVCGKDNFEDEDEAFSHIVRSHSEKVKRK